MVISADGYILTNNHVIDQATSITVTEVTTGRTYAATVVGYDSTDDVAVLHVRTPGGGAVSGKTITIGNSNAIQLGEPVLAIGNAGGWAARRPPRRASSTRRTAASRQATTGTSRRTCTACCRPTRRSRKATPAAR